MLEEGSKQTEGKHPSVLLCAELFEFERAGLFGERNELGAAKEPHPSITRVDKGGLHNTKLDVPSQTFFFFRRPAQEQASLRWVVSERSRRSGSPVRFQGKVAVVVGASALKVEHKAGENGWETYRDSGGEGREREERSPFPLSDA